MQFAFRPSFFLLPLLLLPLACGEDEGSLGGPENERSPEAPAPGAAACTHPKTWTGATSTSDGVILATETDGTDIESVVTDGTHVYWIATDRNGDAGALKRTALDGGAVETIESVGRTYDGPLAIHGEEVLFVENDPAVGSKLVSVPKAGGKRTELTRDVSFSSDAIALAPDGVYVAVENRGGQSDVLIVRIGKDGSSTPVVRAPKDVAPYGVSKLAVAGGRVAWVPGQAVEATPVGSTGPSGKILGDAVVYVTETSQPTSRIPVWGPYSQTRVGGLAMDETNVYFGADTGLNVADVKTKDSSKSFGPQGMPKPYALRLEGDMVYWHTLTAINSADVREGGNAIGRAPKKGGAAEWLVEKSLSGLNWPTFGVASCVLTWRGETSEGRQAIFYRPTSVPGSERPIPGVAAPPSVPGTP